MNKKKCVKLCSYETNERFRHLLKKMICSSNNKYSDYDSNLYNVFSF